MIVTSIEISNVRSYESCHIDFDSGTTLLIGDIGSGKSSVLMAIEFALFGFGGQSSDAILTKGKSSGSVQLAFEAGGHSYEIFRSMKSAGGKIAQDTKHAWISTDGVRDETLGVGELKQKIIEILGTDEPSGTSAETSIFRYAIYTPQEEMKAVLSNPAKRQETIRRAFRIDGFATALENSKKIASGIKRSMKEHSIRFEDLSSLEEKLVLHKNRMTNLNESIISLDAAHTAATAEKKSYEDAYAVLETENTARNSVSGEVDVLESQIETVTQTIASLNNEINEYSENAESLRDKINIGLPDKPDSSMTVRQIDDTITSLRPHIDELIRVSTQIETITSEIDDIKSSYEPADVALLQAELGQLNHTIESSKSERDTMTERISAIRQHISMLEDNVDCLQTGDSCPLCQQDLAGDSGTEIAKTVLEKITLLRAELEELTVSVQKTNDCITSADLKLEDLETSLRNAKTAEETALLITAKSDRLELLKTEEESLSKHRVQLDGLEDIRGMVADYEDLSSALAEAKHELSSIESQIDKVTNDISANNQKLEHVTIILNKKQAEIALFAELDEKLDSARTSLDEWRETKSGLMQDLAIARTELKNAQDMVTECNDSIRDRMSWKAKHKDFGITQEWMEKIFMPSLKIMEERSLEYVRARFNRLYGDFYSILLDDPTKESNIDADFTPVVTESGHEQSVDNLSGGEKTSIALAYRLTLSKMVREDTGIDSGVLMLDEPTDGFSKSQLEKVRIVLDEAGATQVIMVSHDVELESYADRIYRVSKSGGRSLIVE